MGMHPQQLQQLQQQQLQQQLQMQQQQQTPMQAKQNSPFNPAYFDPNRFPAYVQPLVANISTS